MALFFEFMCVETFIVGVKSVGFSSVLGVNIYILCGYHISNDNLTLHNLPVEGIVLHLVDLEL